ncbi:TetR/AcrR family transcriptional regulator [Rhodopseudomonas palustris]|uniref:TetR/AcrR family transcriptional regulator n=1 Tax=Rhodopseudomonas palustris TaxID=1076 RepID=UPI001F2805E9|nr:helix-turn-helix domain-containing protein [Rhodopseudomonas palustris]
MTATFDITRYTDRERAPSSLYPGRIAAGNFAKAKRAITTVSSGNWHRTDPLPPREQTREKLRQKIIAGARALLSETESAEFSMRALAARADVAHMTPYNVFGSKQAVLLAVLDADMADFTRAVQERDVADPLSELYEVVGLCAEFWFSEPVFYKTLYRELLDLKGAPHQAMATPLRDGFWRRLTHALAEQGYLQSFVAEEPLSMNLRRIALQAISVWIARDLSKREVEAELGYSISLALLGVTAPASSSLVLTRLLNYQAIIEEAGARDG